MIKMVVVVVDVKEVVQVHKEDVVDHKEDFSDVISEVHVVVVLVVDNVVQEA